MELTRRSLLSIFFTKSDDSGDGSSFFIKNGSKLLKELIAQYGGRSKIPLRNYSSKEISQATDNFGFHGGLIEDSSYRIYRGSFEKNQILVKKYFFHHVWEHRIESFVVRDIVISSHMSFHKNVLKLIGYCLDYEYPALVYQSPETCNCLKHNLLSTKLTLESKLSLASDIANVLAYLHTGFQTPIVHRNMILGHFVIDKYGTAKFADFSFCISIPLGESQVEDVVIGTNGMADPIYVATGVLTEKTDVYNFGLVLIELLTRRRLSYLKYNDESDFFSDYWRSYVTKDEIEGILNGDVVMKDEMGRDEEIRAFAALALKCIGDDRESRPEMVNVAKELRRIQRCVCSASAS